MRVIDADKLNQTLIENKVPFNADVNYFIGQAETPTIAKQLENLAQYICDELCRYTHEGATEEVDGVTSHCEDCLLTRML